MFEKIFIIIGVVVFIIMMVIIGGIMVKSQLEKSVEELFSLSQDISGRVYSHEQIEGLPEPVQRYFRYSLQENQPYISYVRLKHGGNFRLKSDQKWMSIRGEEYFTAQKIGFVWFGKLPLFSVIDQYIDGRGSLVAKLLSLIKVADANGEKIDQGELLRWLGEAPWYPTALLPSEKLTWESVDNNSAKVILSNQGLSVQGIFYFNKEGQITKFTSKRYKEDTLENWTGYYRDYKEVNGMQIPHDVEVMWNLESGNFSYARFNITEIEYNNPSKFK